MRQKQKLLSRGDLSGSKKTERPCRNVRLYLDDDGDNDNDIPTIELSGNNVTRHIDISNNVDVCNNTMVCTHMPSQDKLAMLSTNYLSQRDSKHFCDEVHKDLNCNTFWSNHTL